ncbi:MAG: SRPBCC domain-containing protein [Actinomycetota bacterium]
MAMPPDLRTSHSVDIDAPIEDVWRALTTPAVIERWFFGVRTVTDWKEGSPLVHTGEWQGKPYEDKGTIVRVEPGELLVHTHWSPMSGLPDLAENYQEVTWALAEAPEGTRLTVSETNLPSEQAKTLSDTSWVAVLGNLKRVLEG